MIRFYSHDIETTLLLPESDSAHCSRVLRKKRGDIIEVIDGKGGLFECKILNPDSKNTTIEIINKKIIDNHSSYSLVLGVAPTKNMDRMEWMVEKCIEIGGVNKICFIRCEHSERKDINLERIKKIAVSALKQSLQYYLPEITYYNNLKQFLEETQGKSRKFVGYCSDEFERKDFVKLIKPKTDTVILIGPEGDFSQKEISETIRNNFEPVSFGDNRLRTETAALYAVTALKVINDLN